MPYESHHHHHHHHHHHDHHHDCHGSRGRGGDHGGFRDNDFHPDGFRPDFHSDRHPDFRPGIPGDYFEQVEGTYVEPPFARRRDDDMPVIPLSDADELTGFPSPGGESMGETLGTVDGGASPLGVGCEVGDALRCLRLACKALSDMADVVADQRGIDVSVSFLPPYCGEPCLSPMEWAILVDGEMVFYGSYDKLCEIWMEGPDAMYEHLCSVIDTADAMGALMTMLGDIIDCGRNDGDKPGSDDAMPFQDPTGWVPDVDPDFVSSVLDACGLGGDDEDCDGDADDDRDDDGHHCHHDGHRHDGHRHDGHRHDGHRHDGYRHDGHHHGGHHHGYHGHRGGHHHGHHDDWHNGGHDGGHRHHDHHDHHGGHDEGHRHHDHHDHHGGHRRCW